MGKRHKPIDVIGRRIKIGDTVRVSGVPQDICWMSKEGQKESLPVFKYLVGKYKKTLGFDEYGFAELVFRIRKGQLKGLHIISIEPFLLKIRQQRIKTLFTERCESGRIGRSRKPLT